LRGFAQAVVAGFITRIFGVEGEHGGALVTVSVHVCKTPEGNLPQERGK
jgi:hypothetical protein